MDTASERKIGRIPVGGFPDGRALPRPPSDALPRRRRPPAVESPRGASSFRVESADRDRPPARAAPWISDSSVPAGRIHLLFRPLPTERPLSRPPARGGSTNLRLFAQTETLSRSPGRPDRFPRRPADRRVFPRPRPTRGGERRRGAAALSKSPGPEGGSRGARLDFEPKDTTFPKWADFAPLSGQESNGIRIYTREGSSPPFRSTEFAPGDLAQVEDENRAFPGGRAPHRRPVRRAASARGPPGGASRGAPRARVRSGFRRRRPTVGDTSVPPRRPLGRPPGRAPEGSAPAGARRSVCAPTPAGLLSAEPETGARTRDPAPRARLPAG